jgi:hypothetical protein
MNLILSFSMGIAAITAAAFIEAAKRAKRTELCKRLQRVTKRTHGMTAHLLEVLLRDVNLLAEFNNLGGGKRGAEEVLLKHLHLLELLFQQFYVTSHFLHAELFTYDEPSHSLGQCSREWSMQNVRTNSEADDTHTLAYILHMMLNPNLFDRMEHMQCLCAST